ncbi:MAG: 3-phosphoshikimate 1-carboxyvinyltransferase [Candidatus Altiarchaeales archaeon]|nr:3-phosphoshikimate 1-carboxyvinyltransferase [Candidatus Altiarchaeota archaeon]MBU4341665.1 3-phosphoshikimate 1-carboxyvinyltransferase [Candidatus Altiarchaeota archaeon]MBU4437850.1 3-phosphoshikimate 1-carboxyvinyltransferase [Candidatus Altiarchaeota archaeon]MCG2783435.1 3-phosphoshikimate 1-carboxyvinyltransferase [Candidatus Altiarchaeales archaeon]
MSEVTVRKSELKGSIKAPASKSYTHRAIICASLAEGNSKIINFLDCDDTWETVDALRKFGIGINEADGALNVSGSKLKAPEEPVELGASGTTYRFLLPLAAIAEGETKIQVKGRLAERPIEPLLDALRQLGIEIKAEGNSIIINGNGKIEGGKVRIPGDVSSQFISGLLFIAPLAEKGIEIELTTALESKPYVDMTISVMKEFGIKADGLRVGGGQSFKAMDYEVEGDYSSAAFLLAAGAINGGVEITGLNPESVQGDRRIVEILKRMNSEIEINGNSIKTKTSNLKGIDIDVKDIPDMVPILSVLGCFADGETRILSAGRLRGKESDRLATMAAELGKMGAAIEERGEGLMIKNGKLSGAKIDPHNDHRIAMACTVAGLNAEGETVIENSDCVKKSYPDFFKDLTKVGADIT